MKPVVATVMVAFSMVACTLLLACSHDVDHAGRRTEAMASASAVPVIASPGAADAGPTSSVPSDTISPRLLRRFQPLPASFEDPRFPRTPERIELGRTLYYDRRLSIDGDLSCNGCHDLADYGVDHRAASLGHRKHVGERNAPSVYNAGGLFAEFWDGRSPNVEDQAKGPILNPNEMAEPDAAHVVATLHGISAYRSAFRAAFPEEAEPITIDNVGIAIGAFERGLVTPGRWDRFLRGDKSALTSEEKEGLKTFLNVGCMVCHTGPLLGGSMFERAGAVEPWPNQSDTGRSRVTHSTADAMMFKVPSLRNIEKTAPYFHDGSADTLEAAVTMMGKHQLGLDLSEPEVASIVTWLKSLTGEIPEDYVAPPRGLRASR